MINKDKQNSSLKILACCHKEPNELLLKMMDEQPYLHPIFCGDVANKITYNEINGRKIYKDNTGDNLSNLNIHINEQSGIYWAWKHYEELGNPDYIGFCHYRRFFYTKDVNTYMQSTERCIAVVEPTSYNTILQHIICNHPRASDHFRAYANELTKQEFNEMFDTFCQINLTTRFAKSFPFTNNMFILSKDEFYKLCEWLFPKVLRINDSFDKSEQYYLTDIIGKRQASFIAEELVAYYIWKNYFITNDLLLRTKLFASNGLLPRTKLS